MLIDKGDQLYNGFVGLNFWVHFCLFELKYLMHFVYKAAICDLLLFGKV